MIARMGRLLPLFLLLAQILRPAQVFAATPADPYNLTFAWSASSSSEVVGYNLYYGTISGIYTNKIPVGNLTTTTISGLSGGVSYYFATTAFSADGQESDFSNEVSYQQKLFGPKMQIASTSNGQFKLALVGSAGGTYDIEASQDLMSWLVIGTVTLDTNGAVDFTDPNTANFSKRFYRTRNSQL